VASLENVEHITRLILLLRAGFDSYTTDVGVLPGWKQTPRLRAAIDVKGLPDAKRKAFGSPKGAEIKGFPKTIWTKQGTTQHWKGLEMLVLSRYKDESIMVGEDVEVTIVEVRGNKVRLGITAPRFIPIHRREVYEAIQREKAEKPK